MEDRLEIVLADEVRAAMRRYGPRELVSPTPEYPIFVDRRKALFALVRVLPRSQGARWDEKNQKWISGTFDTHERLEAAAAMGFDVVIPPIHPIGRSFRKGPNNTLNPGPADPGSPWAIGAEEVGTMPSIQTSGTLTPSTGSLPKAKSLGLEIAMDFAPGVAGSPMGYRASGVVLQARRRLHRVRGEPAEEVPGHLSHQLRQRPRQDLPRELAHPQALDEPRRTDLPRRQSAYQACQLWAWLLGEVRKTDPDVLFLAEAFTKPAMMHSLGKVGYQQSYTYFTWRNEKWEIEDMKELTTRNGQLLPARPWPPPDILPHFLQWGGKPAFTIRAVLGSTLSPLWGI